MKRTLSAEEVDRIASQMFALLQGLSFSDASNLLTAHLQRVICDEAKRDGPRVLDLVDEAIDSLNHKILSSKLLMLQPRDRNS